MTSFDPTHPAGRLAEAIGRASAIRGITRADGVEQGWSTSPNRLLVDLHLERDQRARIAALATLLDWRLEARARGEVTGPWAGRLDDEAAAHAIYGVPSVLHDLGQAWGTSVADTLDRLTQLRAATATREPPLEALTLPEVPVVGFELPFAAGEHPVGRLDLGAEVTLLEGGFPGIGMEPVAACTRCFGTRPGAWTARLVIEASASPLTREVLDADDPTVWLILAHDDAGAAPTDRSAVVLDVGDLGKITLVAGAPTPAQLASVRHCSERYIERWAWGIVWQRPRCPAPVVLGGPAGAHTWIALADPVSQ